MPATFMLPGEASATLIDAETLSEYALYQRRAAEAAYLLSLLDSGEEPQPNPAQRAASYFLSLLDSGEE